MPPKPQEDAAAADVAVAAPTEVAAGNDDAAVAAAVPEAATNTNVVATPSNTVQEHNYDSVKRDNFWSFIPELCGFGSKIVSNELTIAQKAITKGPSFTLNYMSETVSFYKENPRKFYDEVISGFTVAIMQVPESIAFSFVAGEL